MRWGCSPGGDGENELGIVRTGEGRRNIVVDGGPMPIGSGSGGPGGVVVRQREGVSRPRKCWLRDRVGACEVVHRAHGAGCRWVVSGEVHAEDVVIPGYRTGLELVARPVERRDKRVAVAARCVDDLVVVPYHQNVGIARPRSGEDQRIVTADDENVLGR